MSQTRATLMPCTPKAASIKGRLHVPSATPTEHPAVPQDKIMPLSQDPLWMNTPPMQCNLSGTELITCIRMAHQGVLYTESSQARDMPVSRACSAALRFWWNSLRRAIVISPGILMELGKLAFQGLEYWRADDWL